MATQTMTISSSNSSMPAKVAVSEPSFPQVKRQAHKFLKASSPHKRLTLHDRYEIKHSLKNQDSFKEIGRKLDKDCTTISKEVWSHNIVTETGNFSKPLNSCVFRYSTKCKYSGICDMDLKNYHKIAPYKKCFLHCPNVMEEHCPKLESLPMSAMAVKGGYVAPSENTFMTHEMQIRKAPLFAANLGKTLL